MLYWSGARTIRTVDDMTTVIDEATRSASADHTTWIERAEDLGRELAPLVREHDARGEICRSAFERLRATGLTAALVPSECGGAGIDHALMGDVLRTLARYDGPTALTLSMHSHVLGLQVWRHRHGMDAGAVFAKVLDGALLISTGASDWVGSNGSTIRVEGGYRVSARKGPASGCEVGDVLATSVRWDDAPDGPSVIHCSIPIAADGVSIDETWDTLGMRATGSQTVVLDDVFVPEAAVSLVRPADRWHPIWNAVIPTALPLIMSAYVGVADAAMDEARRSVAGREDPHVVSTIGQMATAHRTADDLVAAMFLDAGDLAFDASDELSSRTLARKSVATDALIETVRLAIEATGGRGFSRTSDLERCYRDIHGALFHPLPRAKQGVFSGRVALGLDPV